MRAGCSIRCFRARAESTCENSSDFKLLDRIVVDAITRELPERQSFYRGLADWVGYRHASIPFDVAARRKGRASGRCGNWSSSRSTAIVSFTSAPLRIVTILGLLTLAFGFVVGAEALIGWLQGRAVSGFTTTITTLLIIGSFIMISLGIIGEYIAKIYDEIKARPAYLVEDTAGIDVGVEGPVPTTSSIGEATARQLQTLNNRP